MFKPTETRRFPSAAWGIVTKEFEMPIIDSEVDHKGLDGVLGINQWHSITSDKILHGLSYPAMKNIVNGIIEHQEEFFRINSGELKKVRVLDEKACSNTLKQIEEELETQNWLKNLIPLEKKAEFE